MTAQFDTVAAAAEGADAPAATGPPPVTSGARSVAEKLGLRCAHASHQPVSLPSPHRRPPARRGPSVAADGFRRGADRSVVRTGPTPAPRRTGGVPGRRPTARLRGLRQHPLGAPEGGARAVVAAIRAQVRRPVVSRGWAEPAPAARVPVSRVPVRRAAHGPGPRDPPPGGRGGRSGPHRRDDGGRAAAPRTRRPDRLTSSRVEVLPSAPLIVTRRHVRHAQHKMRGGPRES